MTTQDVEYFDMLKSQLEGLHAEISFLSNKSPDFGLGAFKLKLVNQILVFANEFLGEKYKPFKDFNLFEELESPSYSDVALLLTQYLKCFEIFRINNIRQDVIHPYHWYWIIGNYRSQIRTAPPIFLQDK
jgi:hypothetical protein